jgi:hypothetical protein
MSHGKFGVYPYDLFGLVSGLMLSTQFDVIDSQSYVSEEDVRVFLERFFIRSDRLLIPTPFAVEAF